MNGDNQEDMILKRKVELKINLNIREIFHLLHNKEIIIFETN